MFVFWGISQPMGPIFSRRARPFALLVLVLAATAVATSYGQILRLDAIPLALRQPSGFRPAGPVHHTPTFNGLPFRVSLAANW